jgi:hypothetical protein
LVEVTLASEGTEEVTSGAHGQDGDIGAFEHLTVFIEKCLDDLVEGSVASDDCEQVDSIIEGGSGDS